MGITKSFAMMLLARGKEEVYFISVCISSVDQYIVLWRHNEPVILRANSGCTSSLNMSGPCFIVYRFLKFFELKRAIFPFRTPFAVYDQKYPVELNLPHWSVPSLKTQKGYLKGVPAELRP